MLRLLDRACRPGSLRSPEIALRPNDTDAAPSNRLRVLIYDDYEVFRVGLRVVLQSVHDLVIVGEAETPADAIAMSRDLDPDIVLVSNDLRPEATRLIRTLHQTGARIISINHGPVERGTIAAQPAGASLHLAEPLGADQLVDAIRREPARAHLPHSAELHLGQEFIDLIHLADGPCTKNGAMLCN